MCSDAPSQIASTGRRRITDRSLRKQAASLNLHHLSQRLAHTSPGFSHDAHMATIQSAAEIRSLLAHLKGRTITALQVLGINSLKSVSPPPDALAGEVVRAVKIVERSISIKTASHLITFDLQRTGRVVLHEAAEPFHLVAGTPRPTVRLLMDDGSGLDLTEPAKTKRITVAISAQPE